MQSFSQFQQFIKVISLATVGSFTLASIGRSQPVIEGNNQTQTQVLQFTSNQFGIRGGVTSSDGKNLFHGFEQFNLNSQQLATFLNTPNIENILSKISNGQPSFIDGTIQTLQGTPNLYFLNPAGIIFGNNAQLNVSGDFVASTATALGFENGWFNVSGANNFANLVGNPTGFSFNTTTVGDIIVQGNLDLPVGNLGLIGGRIEGDRRISSPQNLLVTTVAGKQAINLRQPGNILSLELDTNTLDLGNPLNFSVTQLPQLLTGSGDINLNQVSAKYGIIAAENELNFNNSLLQTQGHLALLGRGIKVQDTQSNSGLNLLLISGESDGIYQNQKPFLEAIANGINFAIEADPLTGAPIITTENSIDTLETSTFNAADINLVDSRFQAQNIYLLGDNINIQNSQLNSQLNSNIFALNSVNLKDSATQSLQLNAGNDISIRGNKNLNIESFLNSNSIIRSNRDLSIATSDASITEAILNSGRDTSIQVDNLLMKNSQITTGNDLNIIASESIILEDIADSQREANYSSTRPLRLIANGELNLQSGNILRVVGSKNESLLQGLEKVTLSTAGDSIEALGNFKSNGNIQVGSLTTPTVLIEGGNWEAGGHLSWLAQNDLIIKDFYKTVLNNYGSFDLPLTVSANQIHLAGDNFIDIYLGKNSSLASEKDFVFSNSNKIYITGNLSSQADLRITTNKLEIGINSLELGSNLMTGQPVEGSIVGLETVGFESGYFGGNLMAGNNIFLQAEDTLTLSDYRNQPLNFEARNVYLSGKQAVRLDTMNDPNSLVNASQDVEIMSDNSISQTGRIKINSGEDILIQAPIISLLGSQLEASKSISLIASDLLKITNLDEPTGTPSDKPFVAIAPEINLQGDNNIDIRLAGVSGAKIQSQSDLNLSSIDNIFISGNISTTGDFNINSQDIKLIQTIFNVGGDLSIAASNKLTIEDVRSVTGFTGLNYGKVQFDVGNNIKLQGNNDVSIQFYDNLSFIKSGNDVTLIGDGNILNNAQYQVGNNFTIQDLSGNLADWQSTVSINNGYRSLYLKDNTLIPIGQANLAQVYAGGDIKFRNFNGRSLILEAGETIQANTISLNIPIAFGYPNIEGTILPDRTKNFPDVVLSLTGGKNFTTPAQSVFIDFLSVGASFPFLRGTNPPQNPDLSSEFGQINDAITVNDPFAFYLSLSAFAVGGDDTFIAALGVSGSLSPGAFLLSPPSGRLLATTGNTANIGTTNVNLTAIDNPISTASGNVQNTGFITNRFDQDLTRGEEDFTAIAPIATDEEETVLSKKGTACIDTEVDEKNHQQILACYEEKLYLARAQANTNQQSIELSQLGFFYYQNNRYVEALTTYQERLILAQSVQNQVAEAESLNAIAQVYNALGKYDLALEANTSAESLLNKIQGKTVVQLDGLRQSILNNFGFISYAQGLYQIAVDEYQESLLLARRLNDPIAEIEALNQLGLSYFQQTKYEQSKILQQESLALAKTLNSPSAQLQAYEGLAIAEYALKNYDQAVAGFQQALTLAESVGDRHAQARNWTGLGDAQFQRGESNAAVESLLMAVNLWEELRQDLGNADLSKVSLFETQESTYSTLQEVLIETGQTDKALAINERGRSRAFVELLNRGLAPQAANLSIDAPDIAQIQRIAKEQQSTLVSYAIGRKIMEVRGNRRLVDSEILMWVVKPDGQIDLRRQSLDELLAQNISINDLIRGSRCFDDVVCLGRSALNRNRSNISSRSGDAGVNVDPNLQALHQLLIEPIADLLPSNDRDQVVFIPHRSLFLVPFAALQADNGKYLIEDHTIRTAPSIQALDLTHQKQQFTAKNGITIIGNPTMPEGLKQLPGTETEALAIAAMFGTKILTGDEATPTVVTQAMQNSRFVHLATHGLLDGFGDDDAQKIPGAIALAPTEADDGFLSANEILDLKLNNEMVVLSACDTGRGTITEDGVIGLSRSFMGAGVPSVVVSLWQVPDLSTSDLMIEFYRQLQNNPDKAQALRQAMLITREKYPNPEDWAGFTLMGET
ncbi:MAG: CHAT domain-containing protein [Limnothrix sp. RL_2_0]|nr:CHAT domain-containing protein [Limnothrix sp. RL_2_0]